MASGCDKSAEPTILRADAQALKTARLALVAEGKANDIKLVGNGCAPSGHEIVIVDSEKQTLCKADEIGEIWISGPSIAQGYWNRPEDSEQTFRATVGSGRITCPPPIG
jgi:acyl-CoA synthetase (AMP-forming)/AMP-acid ligase II